MNPETDPHEQSRLKIVIESNNLSYIFNKNSYKQEYLQGIISKSDWEKLINEGSKIIGQSWSKKKINDQITLPRLLVIAGLATVLFTIVYMVTLYIASTSDTDQTVVLTISIISITISTVLAGVLATYNFFRKIRKFQTLDEIMKQDVDEYLSAVNMKYSKKLEFSYIEDKKWLECYILDKSNINIHTEESKKLITDNNFEEKLEENGGRQSRNSSSIANSVSIN